MNSGASATFGISWKNRMCGPNACCARRDSTSAIPSPIAEHRREHEPVDGRGERRHRLREQDGIGVLHHRPDRTKAARPSCVEMPESRRPYSQSQGQEHDGEHARQDRPCGRLAGRRGTFSRPSATGARSRGAASSTGAAAPGLRDRPAFMSDTCRRAAGFSDDACPRLGLWRASRGRHSRWCTNFRASGAWRAGRCGVLHHEVGHDPRRTLRSP